MLAVLSTLSQYLTAQEKESNTRGALNVKV